MTYNKKKNIRQLEKKLREINTIFEISSEFNLNLEPNHIMDLLAYSIMGEMLVSKVIYFQRTKGRLHYKMAKGLSIGEKQKLELLMNGKDMEKIEQIIAIDDEWDVFNFLKDAYDMTASLIAPLVRNKDNMGVLIIGEKINNQSFANDEIELISILCNQAAAAIENSRLFKESLEKQKIEEELKIAQEIQNKLFPQKNPQNEHYEITGKNIPSLRVGGDYYDFIPLDENRIAMIIADVSGKGVAASLLMSNLQAILHSLIDYEKDMKSLIEKINHFIYQRTTADRFITTFFGILDTEEHTFSYINSGHNPPYLINSQGKVLELTEGGTIVGIFPFYQCDSGQVQLKSHDVMVFYTDGVTEAMNTQREEYGEERFINCLRQNINLSVENLEKKIFEDIGNFTAGTPQSDDITLIITKRK